MQYYNLNSVWMNLRLASESLHANFNYQAFTLAQLCEGLNYWNLFAGFDLSKIQPYSELLLF